jgi:hypothetical protein
LVKVLRYQIGFPLFATEPYYTPDIPYPQGGRLNRAVNLPSQYLTQSGSGLDRLKMEALSWDQRTETSQMRKQRSHFRSRLPVVGQ